MQTRLTVSLAVVLAAPPVALGLFSLTPWKMPQQLAIGLLLITAVAGIIALGIILHGGWVLARPMRTGYGFRMPVYRLGKPNPHQRLIDIAERQRDNPLTYLVVKDRIVMGFDRDAKRPYLRIRLHYTNLSIHDLIVSPPEGYPYYRAERLPELVRGRGGKQNVPALNGNIIFDLEIFVPEEFLKDVCQELDSDSGEIRQLSFKDLSAKVWVKGDDAPERQWRLGDQRTIIRPNQ